MNSLLNATYHWNDRIAKTGSRTFVQILSSVGNDLGFQVQVPAYSYERTMQEDEEVKEEILEIIKGHENNYIRARHSSFIDFKKHGYKWSPLWFSLVRDPVERVRII